MSRQQLKGHRVVVSGLGLVTALGTTAAATWETLLAGKSGVCMGQPFSELPPRPLATVGNAPADLEDLLGLTVAEAIADARLALPLPDCGVVIGSSRSFQSRWERMAGQNSWDENSWLEALPHMGAIAVARQIQSLGPVLAPMAACATGLTAIFQGYELVRRGQCDRVVVGAAEAPITPLTLAGFEQLGALAATGCYPFDLQREGLVLGEGAAVLVLESEASLKARSGPQPYGCILGAGFSTDAYHRTAPDPELRGSRLALKTCLNYSGLKPDQVGYVHAHGTGTRLNDDHEVRLIQSGFSQLPWMSSTKGATGHTLGASGAIGAAVCLLALRHGVLPPNVGFRGQSIYPNLVVEPTFTTLDAALCFSFGFGGQNAVLALGRSKPKNLS
ncbi:beta-ketoacyl-ACP synthase [Nodosilinea sp. LEGE 07298]|uniref:beta-ketoacyl-ACP synthase n=1 Tax=Nodosilinea sp. LEGE 07298 TaxID=2777970 RepID=UPI00187F486A|nr:beta-ketoacyl-ACP synthase [Nodosilinea sp. LEGE 07298]MBE9110213.1 beta-ketoacyl-ACP synthase [Nodosilinea sp. LEGE 07298]